MDGMAEMVKIRLIDGPESGAHGLRCKGQDRSALRKEKVFKYSRRPTVQRLMQVSVEKKGIYIPRTAKQVKGPLIFPIGVTYSSGLGTILYINFAKLKSRHTFSPNRPYYFSHRQTTIQQCNEF